jgi:zinc-ribbon domain
MSFCQACGTSVDADARFCPRCGKPANIGVLSQSPEMAATANPGLPLAAAAAPAVILQGAPATTTTAPIAAAVAIPARHKRPIGVIIIAILAVLCVVVAIPTAIALLYYSANVGVLGATPLAQFLIALFPVIGEAKTDLVSALNLAALESFAIAAIAAASCYGLLMLREWGRILAIVGIALAMLHAVIVTFTGEGNLLWHLIALGIQTWALTYLLKARVKVCFAR